MISLRYILVLMFFSVVVAAQDHLQLPRDGVGKLIACEKFEMVREFLIARSNQQLREEGNTYAKLPFLLRDESEDTQVGDSEVVESEIHAVVNPSDENHIVVAAVKFNAQRPLRSLAISIYVTFDQGESWSRSSFNGLKENIIVIGGGDPILVFDSDGNLEMTWLRLDAPFTFGADLEEVTWGIYSAISDDGGISWGEETVIDKYTAQDIFTLSDLEVAVDKQWMTADNNSASDYFGNVYMSYTAIQLDTTTYNIVFSKRVSGTDAYTEAIVVNRPLPNEVNQFSSIVVDDNGVVYITYLRDPLGSSNLYEAYLVKSEDGGSSFSDPIFITNIYFSEFGSSNLSIHGLSDSRIYPCAHIAIDKSTEANNDKLYFTFTGFGLDDQISDHPDIYLCSSIDGGDSWTTPTIVNDNLNVDSGQFYSSIVVDNHGGVALGWYDRRNNLEASETNTDYYLSYAKDGDNFDQFPITAAPSDFNVIGDNNAGFSIGEYNEIVVAGDLIVPFWADGRTNNGDISVYAYFYNPNDDVSTQDVLKEVKEEVKMVVESNASDLYVKIESEVLAREYKIDFLNNQSQLMGTYAIDSHLMTQIDISAFPSSVYYIICRWDGGHLTRKWVKN